MRLKQETILFGAGLVAVLVSLTSWLFWYYPTLGHDQTTGIPALFEFRYAWQNFGVFDIDFSPIRCLGQPNFANPNTLTWSLFHFAALAIPAEIYAMWSVLATFMVFAYVGCYRLLRGLGMGGALACLLTVGWCLQGFAVTHTVPGHNTYLQFILSPLLLWIVLHKRMGWMGYLTAGFWIAHLFYTSGVYLFLVGMPAILAAAWILQSFADDRLKAANLGGLKTAFVNLVKIGPLVAVMTAAKLLASLNFSAMYPRLAELVRIDDVNALVYTASSYFFPFPYDVKFFTGWWYGNWESYEFILPGFAYFLIWLAWRRRESVAWQKALGVFLTIIFVGTVLSSGVLGPVFKSLPVLKSLHVNPRWNSMTILPFFALAVSLLLQAGYGSGGKRVFPRKLWWCFAAFFVVVPFFFIDKENMAVNYPDGAGIDRNRGRLTFCYEPVFGYGLETFPLGKNTNWLQDTMIDPRCYFKSGGCAPGSYIQRPGVDPGDDAKLKNYTLKDEYPPVKNLKPFSFVTLMAGMLTAFAWLFVCLRELWRMREDE